jgi:hypothetical protein
MNSLRKIMSSIQFTVPQVEGKKIPVRDREFDQRFIFEMKIPVQALEFYVYRYPKPSIQCPVTYKQSTRSAWALVMF